MKKFLFVTLFVLSGIATSLHAQYYNYNTTTKSKSGYSTNQSYYSKKGSTNVNTTRSSTGYGGYNSSTSVYSNGGIKSTSTTTKSPYGGTSTVKQNYQTGTATYKYSTPKSTYRTRRY
jgi:hypothetical protein